MYQPSEWRYEGMEYKRCGRSGLKLPAMSLGLWQNFGTEKTLKEQEEILCHAFDRGITHLIWPTITAIRQGTGRGELWPGLKGLSGTVPGRAGRLHQGRVRYVAGALWKLGLQEISHGQPGSELKAHGPGLRGYFYHHGRIRKRPWKRPWRP